MIGNALPHRTRDITRRVVFATCGLGLGLALASCASAPRQAVLAPRLDVASLIREADAEIKRGCYVCLRSGAATYEKALAADADGTLVTKAAGAWALVSARERQLGLKPTDALDRARALRGRSSDPVIDAYMYVASHLPLGREGVSAETLEAAGRASRDLLTPEGERRLSEAKVLLTDRVERDGDPAASYLIASVICSEYLTHRAPSPADMDGVARLQTIPALSDLMTFRMATCDMIREVPLKHDALVALIGRQSRFHEASYFLGHLWLAEKRLVSSESAFLRAADGLPGMAAAWALLGSVRMALEEYDIAASDLGRALSIEPDQREVLLTQARALNYAGQFQAALVPAQRLISLGVWYQADANFWLALSELQLGRLQDADLHVREAKPMNSNDGDTARLSGLLALRLDDLPRAQAEFELAISRNDADCESRLQLGTVYGRQGAWETSVASFVRARQCYAAAKIAAEAKRVEIENSSLSAARRDLALLRLAQRVARHTRSQADAALGAAEGETQRGAYEAALSHLADAGTEPELGPRVSELRRRIEARQTKPFRPSGSSRSGSGRCFREVHDRVASASS